MLEYLGTYTPNAQSVERRARVTVRPYRVPRRSRFSYAVREAWHGLCDEAPIAVSTLTIVALFVCSLCGVFS